MKKIDELYDILKEKNNKKINGYIKDVVIIDGAIVQDNNLEYKKDMYISLEEKYKDELDKLKYSKVEDIVDVKVEKYVESAIKDINTKLGTLKTFLIRMAGIDIFKNEKIEDILAKIKNEISPKIVYELFEKLDEELVNNIK